VGTDDWADSAHVIWWRARSIRTCSEPRRSNGVFQILKIETA
jgi:hypothetical protein